MGNWFAERLGPPQTLRRFEPNQPQAYQPPSQYQPLPGQQIPQYAPQPQQVAIPQQIANTQELLAYKDYWQGTQEQHQHTAACPKCGGPLQTYTQHGDHMKMNKEGERVSPMPRCYYCGFNAHFEQIGQQATDSGVVIRVLPS